METFEGRCARRGNLGATEDTPPELSHVLFSEAHTLRGGCGELCAPSDGAVLKQGAACLPQQSSAGHKEEGRGPSCAGGAGNGSGTPQGETTAGCEGSTWGWSLCGVGAVRGVPWGGGDSLVGLLGGHLVVVAEVRVGLRGAVALRDAPPPAPQPVPAVEQRPGDFDVQHSATFGWVGG